MKSYIKEVRVIYPDGTDTAHCFIKVVVERPVAGWYHSMFMARYELTYMMEAFDYRDQWDRISPNDDWAGDLTKEQAYQAMKAGRRISHKYFSAGEYIYLKWDNHIWGEDGVCFPDEYWDETTKGSHFQTGWKIYEPKKENI